MTIKYSFKTTYLSKMPPKRTEGENFFFCHEKIPETFPNFHVSRQEIKSFSNFLQFLGLCFFVFEEKLSVFCSFGLLKD
jgi:hypothetical protein